MMHLYGIGQRVQFVIMLSSLHIALMMQLEMRLNGYFEHFLGDLGYLKWGDVCHEENREMWGRF